MTRLDWKINQEESGLYIRSQDFLTSLFFFLSLVFSHLPSLLINMSACHLPICRVSSLSLTPSLSLLYEVITLVSFPFSRAFYFLYSHEFCYFRMWIKRTNELSLLWGTTDGKQPSRLIKTISLLYGSMSKTFWGIRQNRPVEKTSL